jgi:hypothetical protein
MNATYVVRSANITAEFAYETHGHVKVTVHFQFYVDKAEAMILNFQ